MAKKNDYPRLATVAQGVNATKTAFTLSKENALLLAEFLNRHREHETYTIYSDGETWKLTNIERGRLLVELV